MDECARLISFIIPSIRAAANTFAAESEARTAKIAQVQDALSARLDSRLAKNGRDLGRIQRAAYNVTLR